MAIRGASCIPIGEGKREMTVDEFKRWLKNFDANRDGRISKEELEEAIRFTGGWFAKWKGKRGVRSADTNGNGFVDDGEIKELAGFAEKYLGVRISGF